MQNGVIGIPAEPWGLSPTESTIAQGMKELGYATHMVGKWHLGLFDYAYHPTRRGFDTQFGYLSGEEDYMTHMTGQYLDFWRSASDPTSPTGVVGGPTWNYTNYSAYAPCDHPSVHSMFVFAAEAEGIIAKHARETPTTPLFLYLPFQNVHAPLDNPGQQYVDLCSGIPNADRKIYCAMTRMADEAVLNITNALKAANLWDNTLLVISGDNGGEPSAAGNNWPLRGRKFTLWEGGVHNNAFIVGAGLPDNVKGTEYNGLFHITDWRPTLQRVAGNASSAVNFALDGHDMWDVITKGYHRSRFFFREALVARSRSASGCCYPRRRLEIC